MKLNRKHFQPLQTYLILQVYTPHLTLYYRDFYFLLVFITTIYCQKSFIHISY